MKQIHTHSKMKQNSFQKNGTKCSVVQETEETSLLTEHMAVFTPIHQNICKMYCWRHVQNHNLRNN